MAITFMAFALASCASPIETRISSMGVQEPVPSAFVWGTVPVSADGVIAKNAVASRLSASGVQAADGAPARLDITFSALPAALRINTGDKPVTGRAKPPRATKTCDPVELRLGVAITRIGDGVLAYRSSAAEYHCRSNMGDAIPSLAEAALRDLGKPMGSYTVERRRLR